MYRNPSVHCSPVSLEAAICRLAEEREYFSFHMHSKTLKTMHNNGKIIEQPMENHYFTCSLSTPPPHPISLNTIPRVLPPSLSPSFTSRSLKVGRGVDASAMELAPDLPERQGRCHRTEKHRKDERRRPNLTEHLRVECRGPGIEAWQVRSRTDAPQVVEHGSHRMHIQQQRTLPW